MKWRFGSSSCPITLKRYRFEAPECNLIIAGTNRSVVSRQPGVSIDINSLYKLILPSSLLWTFYRVPVVPYWECLRFFCMRLLGFLFHLAVNCMFVSWMLFDHWFVCTRCIQNVLCANKFQRCGQWFFICSLAFFFRYVILTHRYSSTLLFRNIVKLGFVKNVA